MSDLISGKEALIALANGDSVEACVTHRLEKDEWHWFNAKSLTVNEIEEMETGGNLDGSNILAIAFRLKPRTITINGIEVPSPFLPDEGELFYHTSPEYGKGYAKSVAHERNETTWQQFGAWRTEEQIKQVVAALRSIFNVK